MFGIGGGELILIILIGLMLFGSEKIPDIARTLGKGMAQLKNATNEIKSEIQRSADHQELNSLTRDFNREVEEVKSGFNAMVDQETQKITGENLNPFDVTSEINEAKQNIEDLTGPIKRQM
ncbi:twin-arginine translocase TatA/TatE family subunit [Flavobacterium luminosum]|uniref:Sec-independent protein translocase protein TatA n=1 Tax=Flavobacterium luminosum TaxID=2949086 RepID=A0ABT0TL34_9FLAO|nr:twin-arginine translocase TatA/TatE family subunit [Flavobacterium sp. HXWNR70]MCL9808021.1 twin-arginine translocase TatA/TatE family subunit [Flavobacterium sp. HXWNR70]